MHVSLSKLLQLRFNVFLYKRLSWEAVFFYIVVLGRLYFFFNRREKDKIEEAVESVFEGFRSKSEMKAIKRNVFQGIMSHYYEKLFNAYERIEGLSDFFKESIEIHCLNKLDNALKDGKGVLFVTGHYGGIEYIPIFLALKKYPISVIAKFKTKELKETLYQKTKGVGLKIIDADQKNGTLSSIIKELQQNRIVFMECDEIEEWRPSQKERISFLGKRIGVDKTINIIQKRTGTKVVFGILHRFNLEKYSLILESYQDILQRVGKATSSIGEGVLESFEQYIYSYPEEWYQWKNFSEIKTVPGPGIKVERQTSLSMLKPALGKVT
jgi:KDO2-lipid IV(A) lauroyltransferase